MYNISLKNPPGYDLQHYSESLKRKKTLRIVPSAKTLNNNETRFCVFFHSFGGDRFSFLKHTSASFFKNFTNTVFIFPESGRYWFINDASGNRYEDYIILDLLPLISEHFNFEGNSKHMIIGGFSMGGAAAVYLSLKYPDIFDVSFSYSGAFYASERVGDPYAKDRQNKCMMPTENEHCRVWGLPGSMVRKMYDPNEIINFASRKKRTPKIIIAVGAQDYPRVIKMNRKMNEALENAKIKKIYSEIEGDHTWKWATSFTTDAIDTILKEYEGINYNN